MEQAENARLENRKILGKIWSTICKIREVFNRYSRSLSLAPYFEFFDVRKEGVITYREFLNVLLIHLKDVIGLSKDQATELADFYKGRDGRVLYKQFVDCIDLDCETVIHPRYCYGNEQTYLGSPNPMDGYDKKQLDAVLNAIAARVYAMDISLIPVFRQYEVVVRSGGVMPISQFTSALEFLQIKLNKSDFYLVLKRYLHNNFAVNYVLFTSDIEDRISQLISCGLMNQYGVIDERKLIQAKPCDPPIHINPLSDIFYTEPEPHPAIRQIPFNEKAYDVFRQVQFQINVDRVNIEPFFTPLDPLRSGTVLDFQFIKVLNNCGVQKSCMFTETELKSLCDLYRVFSDPRSVNYRLFLSDIQNARNPIMCSVTCEYPAIRDMRKRTHIRGNYFPHTTKVRKEACELALRKLQKFLKERHLTLITDFQREDLGNFGHVSPGTFRKVIGEVKANLILSATEMKSLDDRYIDLKGFDYRRFLDEIHEGVEHVVPTEKDVTAELFDDNPSIKIENPPPLKKGISLCSPEEVINKLKLQVKQLRVALDDYIAQYNPLRESFVPMNLIWRALSSAGFRLNQQDMDMVVKLFGTPLRNNVIDVKQFLETIYSDEYQLGLEKTPLIIPLAGIPILDKRAHSMSRIEREELEEAMHKLGNKAEFFVQDLFREFDKVGTGIIEKKDFPRALSYLGRGNEYLLTNRELDLVYKGFCRSHGIITGLDYAALCKAVKAVRELNPI
ncbi:uncharacterized protein LOC106670517 [Cimex lectularius]|uniref:EF-hand domain-containing protein n=1 Tax=Cimex lectularius TaxID=79782 RepID=A0A8I6S5A8_CIMLE|nr:uncharacterized protein LOC106670517 [Cimex lectularius]